VSIVASEPMAPESHPGGVLGFLTRRRGGPRLSFSDVITYLYLLLGTVVMFGPVIWLVMSSFKPSRVSTSSRPRSCPPGKRRSWCPATISRWTCTT